MRIKIVLSILAASIMSIISMNAAAQDCVVVGGQAPVIGTTTTDGCATVTGTADATGDGVAIGKGTTAVINGVAVGSFSTADFSAVALGEGTFAGIFGVAIGQQSYADYGSTALGWSSNAVLGSTALGWMSSATGLNSVAVGDSATASGERSVALGGASAADRAYTVSVGNAALGITRQITSVSAGTELTDAVNLFQLSRLSQALGAGSSFAGGVFTAPTYVFLSGATYNNVGSALTDLDGRVTALENASPGAPGPAGADGKSAYEVAQANGFTGTKTEWLASLKGETGAQGPQGEPGQVGEGAGKDPYFTADADGNTDQSNPAVADGAGAVAAGASSSASGNGSVAVGKGASAAAENSVALGSGSVADQANTVSVGSAGNERQMTHVAAGVNATDAVNVAQMQAGDVATLNTANNYTDLRSQQTLESANAYTDWRISQLGDEIGSLDRRIDQVGAQGAALTMMASSALNLEPGEVAVQAGWGQYRSSAAFAVGAKIRTSQRSAVNMGLSVVNGKAMGGIGVSWNLGR